MKLKMVFLVIFFIFLLCLFFWLKTSQNDFLADVTSTAQSDVEYIMLCEIRAGTVSSLCETIDRSGGVRFSDAIKYLSQAVAKLPPGKVPITSEKLIKIKLRGLTHRCYRVISFSGFDEDYLNQISTDPECTRILKYEPGYVAIHKLDREDKE